MPVSSVAFILPACQRLINGEQGDGRRRDRSPGHPSTQEAQRNSNASSFFVTGTFFSVA